MNASKLREKEEPNIADYATTYGSVYPLAGKVVHCLQDHSSLMPWQSWEATEQRQGTPFWCYAYNQVKHDRFGNLGKKKSEEQRSGNGTARPQDASPITHGHPRPAVIAKQDR